MIENTVKHPYRFFAVAAIGAFIGTLEGSILNVALPTIASDLGVEIDIVAWVVLAYSLTLVSLMMVFGAWTARRGYAFAYRFGFSVLLVGTVVCALSQNLYVLILGRIVQATGGAMLQTVGMGLLTSVFPQSQRGKAIGMMAIVISVGLTAGPPMGGLILSVWPWQAIFVVSIPVALVGLLGSAVVFRGFTLRLSQRPLRITGAVALSLTLLGGMLWLTMVDEYPLSDWRLVTLSVGSIVAGITFVRSELRPGRALIGLDLFRNRQFSISTAAMFLMFAAMAGVLILVPFYLQDIRGLEPRTIGLYLIILPVTMAMFAPVSGRISDRIGYRFLTTLGMVILGLGLCLLLFLGPQSEAKLLIASLIAIGTGVGIFSSPNSSAMMGSVAPRQRPISSGILSTTRVIGLAFGIALSTTVFSYYQSQFAGLGGEAIVFIESWRRVIELSIVMSAVGVLLCAFRKNRLSTGPEHPEPYSSVTE